MSKKICLILIVILVVCSFSGCKNENVSKTINSTIKATISSKNIKINKSTPNIDKKALIKKYPFLSNNTESYLKKGAKIRFKNDPYFYYVDSFNTFQFKPGGDDELESYYKESKKLYKRKDEKIEYRNYLDGVEIVKFISKKKTIDIPETVDGKHVIKLGGFINDYESDYPDYDDQMIALIPCLSYAEEYEIIYIPSSVKEIVDQTFEEPCLKSIKVSKNNKHYCSKNGILYSKNGKRKLFVPSSHPSEEY